MGCPHSLIFFSPADKRYSKEVLKSFGYIAEFKTYSKGYAKVSELGRRSRSMDNTRLFLKNETVVLHEVPLV